MNKTPSMAAILGRSTITSASCALIGGGIVTAILTIANSLAAGPIALISLAVAAAIFLVTFVPMVAVPAVKRHHIISDVLKNNKPSTALASAISAL